MASQKETAEFCDPVVKSGRIQEIIVSAMKPGLQLLGELAEAQGKGIKWEYHLRDKHRQCFVVVQKGILLLNNAQRAFTKC